MSETDGDTFGHSAGSTPEPPGHSAGSTPEPPGRSAGSTPGQTGDDDRWLSDSQQQAWRALVAIVTRLPAALDTQLQRDAGLTHFDYFVLAALSDAPDRRVRLRELADLANASLSRLSHVMTKLEKAGWAQRENIEGARGSYAVLTDAGYDRVVDTAPGHVATVKKLVFDGLDDQQVETLLRLGSAMVTNLDAAIAAQSAGAAEGRSTSASKHE